MKEYISAITKCMTKELMDPAGRDAEEIITDALTDIRHWSESAGENFYQCLERSLQHFIDEGGKV